MPEQEAPMRVLIVHSSAELYGSDRSLLAFVRHRPPAMRVTVVLPEAGPLVAALQACDAQVVVGEVCRIQRGMLSPAGLLRTGTSALRALRFLGRLHRAQRFDLVYSNSIAVLGGAVFAAHARLPHLWHVREILGESHWLTAGFRWLVRALSTQVVCNSEPTRAWIAGPGPFDTDRYRMVWNGYQTPDALPDPGSARAELGVTNEEVLIAMVGRLNAMKGQRLLVEAFALAAGAASPAAPRLRLVLVGSAFAGQEHFEVELRQAIAASSCAERVLLLPFQPDIERIWAAADIAVVPSTAPESFGRVAVEAMAFGKPVVAAAHGGILEIVDHGVTGLLVSPRDRVALAGALRQLAADAGLRERMGRAGRVRQLRLFSERGYADRMVAVLQALPRAASAARP